MLLIFLLHNSDETNTFLVAKKPTHMIISTERNYGETMENNCGKCYKYESLSNSVSTFETTDSLLVVLIITTIDLH